MVMMISQSAEFLTRQSTTLSSGLPSGPSVSVLPEPLIGLRLFSAHA